ncbi:hypothetical protein MVEN_01190700 [Mycena venus]|uniref:Uncharacterized protein n=1 Tax=Mycena venus TaxID=2733690 RepID=A0A8H7CVW3_9AGAR|nr:hypothetical protein MVEN_01190700 [Mycena venus]
MEKGNTWQPHGIQERGTIPPDVSQTSRSDKAHKAWTKLGRWLKGPDTVMDLDVDPDELEACKKQWALKWQKYCEDFPQESLGHLAGMGQAELRARIDWLEAEFTRVREKIPELSDNTSDPQVLAGLLFIGEMLGSCQADLVSVMTAARAVDSSVPEFHIPIEELKTVELCHMFALSCVNKIVTLKQVQAVRWRHQVGTSESDRTTSRRGSLSASEAEAQPATNVRTTPTLEPGGVRFDSRNLTGDEPVNLPFHSEDIGPGRLLGRAINQPQNPLTVVSSSNSHRNNLTALIGIAFFGASITWSTVFSGTRGDLVLISWSACLFIVGAVGAAAASMLLLPDEDLVAKYPPVRWTVRILSLLSMVHVLAGMFLVTLAILLLDPSQESLQARAGRRGVQSAGVYAIAVSMGFVGVSGAMWRRHTIRTWFR